MTLLYEPEENKLLKFAKRVLAFAVANGLTLATLGSSIFAVYEIQARESSDKANRDTDIELKDKEFDNQKNLQQKDRVLQLALKKYEEDESINEIRSSLYRDYDLSSMNFHKTPSKKNHQESVVKFIKSNEDRYQKILTLTNFYNDVALCVESELCDKDTAEKVFKKEGNLFLGNYLPFFCYTEYKWKDDLVKNVSKEFYDFDYVNSCVDENVYSSFF